MKSITSIKINAPISKVFEYISTPEKQILWMDGLVSTEFTDQTKDTNQIGVKFKQHLLKGQKKHIQNDCYLFASYFPLRVVSLLNKESYLAQGDYIL